MQRRGKSSFACLNHSLESQKRLMSASKADLGMRANFGLQFVSWRKQVSLTSYLCALMHVLLLTSTKSTLHSSNVEICRRHADSARCTRRLFVRIYLRIRCAAPRIALVNQQVTTALLRYKRQSKFFVFSTISNWDMHSIARGSYLEDEWRTEKLAFQKLLPVSKKPCCFFERRNVSASTVEFR